MPAAPRLSLEKIREHIDILSLEPMRALYAEFLANAPTPEAIQAAANKSPDRHIQAMTQLHKMAGYAEREGTSETNIYVQIRTMSDSQLRQELDSAFAALAQAGISIEQLRPAIEGEITSIEPAPSAPMPPLKPPRRRKKGESDAAA